MTEIKIPKTEKSNLLPGVLGGALLVTGITAVPAMAEQPHVDAQPVSVEQSVGVLKDTQAPFDYTLKEEEHRGIPGGRVTTGGTDANGVNIRGVSPSEVLDENNRRMGLPGDRVSPSRDTPHPNYPTPNQRRQVEEDGKPENWHVSTISDLLD
jgi:hypothetical protein